MSYNSLKKNPTRAGFLLLMLIAFASILLGLATTFYYYTSRGMEDSQVAVRLAQQRLALSSALNYITAKIPTSPATVLPPIVGGTPLASFYSSSGNPNAPDAGNAVQLSLASVPRTNRMGWFRIARADDVYTPANWPTYDSSNSVFITAGVGPSGGKVVPTNPNDWQFELRSWYLAKLEIAGTGKYIIKTITPVFPPPANYPTNPPTIIYW